MKKAVMSPLGQELANMKSAHDLAFEQIKNLVLMIAGLPEFRDNTGVLLYRKLVVGVIKQKDPEKKKDFIVAQIKPWLKLYNAFRDNILREDLEFLSDKTEETIKLITGNSKNAVLPLGDAYIYLLKNNVEQVDDMQAKLFFLFRHLVSEGADDRKKLDKICEQFEQADAEDKVAGNAINTIVNKVKGQMGSAVGQNGQPDMNNIGAIVQSIFSDTQLQNGMGNLANGVMTGQISIPDLIKSVQKNVQNAEAAKNAEKEENTSD